MNHKVLLADDSLTIQKVIKITLANQPFDIVECISDDELFKKLSEVKPDLVFLDFNLSEKFSGYELATKIRDAVPSARVLLLLGTFDTIDDAAMEKCGAADKIVKPFDSNKFIAICKRLVDTVPLEEIDFPNIMNDSSNESEINSEDDDQWTMSHSVEQIKQNEPKKEAFNVRNHLNKLDQEISDWGMSVPNIINDELAHDKSIDLPPVIGEVKSLKDHKVKSQAKEAAAISGASDIKFPDNNDLDYPTIEELNEAQASDKPQEKPKTKSKLISIESFNQEPEIEHTINAVDETDVSSIEDQIRDEVEEDLWKVDEFEELKNEVAAKIEEVKSNLASKEKYFNESLFTPLDEGEEIQWNTPSGSHDEDSSDVSSAVNMKDLRAEMEEMIKKHVKEYMDEMFKKNVEKIAWEVIPDLAENLIRQEMNKISHKILNESN